MIESGTCDEEDEPSVFLVRSDDDRTKLYLGEYSTLSGLQALNLGPATPVHIELVATDQTVEKSQLLPSGDVSFGELSEWLENLGFGLVEFSCVIKSFKGSIRLSSHDDAECHFEFPNLETCKRVIWSVSEQGRADHLWQALLANPNCYITVDAAGTCRVFPSFDEYLKH